MTRRRALGGALSVKFIRVRVPGHLVPSHHDKHWFPSHYLVLDFLKRTNCIYMLQSSIPYEIPNPPSLLTLSSFLYLINVADYIASQVIHAGLIGPLVVGIVYGSQAADILSPYLQSTFIDLGYIGLLLIVFEAGLSTDISLLYSNLIMSLTVAMTGILVPIAFSIILLYFGYGYSPIQAFAAGAALCSTSLGTTLALLDPAMRQTKVGSVLMSAALVDDIAGLVIAAIIAQLSSSPATSIPWQTIVRPILVSIAFALGTPLLAWILHKFVLKISNHVLIGHVARSKLDSGLVQLFFIVACLSAFVAGSNYAGTSELFGAYLAGVLLTHVFGNPPRPAQTDPVVNESSSDRSHNTSHPHTPQAAFETYINPPLLTMLSPIFFASIGFALPIRSLGSVNGSHRVVWRGIVYSLLMVLAKAVTGIWMLVWPNSGFMCRRQPKARGPRRTISTGDLPRSSDPRPNISNADALPQRTDRPPSLRTSGTEPLGSHEPIQRTFTPTRSALILGFAMVARGEIALIVAQMARPLLESTGDGRKIVRWALNRLQ